MKCINDAKILNYLNDELSEAEEKAIKKHLLECSDCQKNYQEWKQTFSATEQFVKEDISSIDVPEFSQLLNRPQKDSSQEKPLSSFQIWFKPALATAAVVILSLAYFFFPSNNPIKNSDYYLITKNDYHQNEFIEVNDSIFANIENNFVEEIYNDEESRIDFFSGADDYNIHSAYYETEIISEELTDQEIQYMKEEINKMETS